MQKFSRALFTAVALATTSTIAITVATPVQAQQTTSILRGEVLNAQGQPVADTTVQVIHVPSNTVNTATTDGQGRFVALGLRPGGPYAVRVPQVNGQETDLFLNVAESHFVTVRAGTTGEMEEITVTALAGQQATQVGTASYFGEDEVQRLPSLNRDFRDTVRQSAFAVYDPQQDSINFPGFNPRQNRLTIDGVEFTDDFGLANDGFPTIRSPISPDAIEQIAVQVAPYDVTFGQFDGGLINIVTKSGSNEFHGSAFFEFTNDGLTRKNLDGARKPLGEFTEKSYGATIGGPIVKDKLFFFLNYEQFDETQAFSRGPEGSGAVNEVQGVTSAEFEEIRSIAMDRYGFDPGVRPDNLSEDDKKLLAKLDWNITDNHRGVFTFNYNDASDISDSNSDSDELSFEGNFNTELIEVKAFSAQIFSDWTDRLSTEFKIGYKEIDRLRDPNGDPDIPQLIVNAGTQDDEVNVFLGSEDDSQFNRLFTDRLQIKLKADYYWNNHLFTVGYERDDLDIFNVFVEASQGELQFDSIEDFRMGNASQLRFNNAFTGDPADAAADFNVTVNSIYAQDAWEAAPNFRLTGGIRVDFYSQDGAPRENENFFDRHGFSNAATLDGETLVQPRFGFNWKPTDRLTIRGGGGLFGGGFKKVSVAGPIQNDGIIKTEVFVEPGDPLAPIFVEGLDGQTIRDIEDLALQNMLIEEGAPSANTDALDPDFDIPSNWKFNLAVEYLADLGLLGDEWLLKAEYLASRTKDGVDFLELRREQIGTAADGRPIYNITDGFDLFLTNTDKGKSDAISFSVSKAFEDAGVSTYFSYTYQDAKDIHSNTSSVLRSAFLFVPAPDDNNRPLATSNFEVEHKFNATVNWRKEFFGDNATNISAFFETRSGVPFSITTAAVSAPFGGSPGIEVGGFDPDLALFIPECAVGCGINFFPFGPPTPDQAAAAEANLQEFITELNLEKFVGDFVPRNHLTTPWRTTMDMRFAQDVPVPGLADRGHKIQFYWDIINLPNLLNSDWGRVERPTFAENTVSFTFFPFNPPLMDGQPLPTFQYNTGNARAFDVQTAQSIWRMKFGLKYFF